MLGYGDTDKPLEAAAYVGSALAKDIIDILDAEHVETSIPIGHDWWVLRCPFLTECPKLNIVQGLERCFASC